MKERIVTRTTVIVGLLTSIILASPAMAQERATLPGEDGGALQWGVALGLAVVVLLTGFLNPKRSHLT